MTILQKTYLGASITSINCNLGWGSSPSQVQIGLVEDLANGDNFIAPSIGGPTFIEYYGISMGGLISSWNRTANTGGDPLYSVTVEDPRSILEGVQLITDGYTGGIFNVPNILNIFGYWESFSFGNSQVNSTGMPWKRIRDGILALVNQAPIKFGTTSYYINLSALPVLPDYFRLPGPNMSIMDFISQMCEAASHDFFFDMEQVGLKYYIKLYTVDRSQQPQLNRISTFVNSQPEVVSTSTGFQLRNETSSRFLVGGNVHTMYFQSPSAILPTSRNDDVVWPFWGTDENNNVIIGKSVPISGEDARLFDDTHGFTLPSKGVNVVGVGEIYTTNVLEMRAALHSIDSWKLLLSSEDKVPGSPHYRKAEHIGLRSDVASAILSDKTAERGLALTPAEFADLTGKTITSASDSISETHDENISRLYEYVKGYASEYYGKKFMVRLPNISSKYNSDTNTIEHNLEPVDGGFLEDALWSGAIANNFLPTNINTLLLDDNRITPYVRYDKFSKLDLGGLSPDDFTISKGSVFIKCTLDQDIYFLSHSGLYSPRAVINLPGSVNQYKKDNTASFDGLKRKVFEEKLAYLPSGVADEILQKLNSRGGADFLALGEAGLAEIPNMVACPLKSNVNFYGPWYAIGANGKTDFEKDENLVPWNYGGFALMNLAANSQISSALSNMQIGEEGSLELAGVPAFTIGDQLISGGPYITDINVSIDARGGATTTYTLRTWGARNTGVQKQLVDRMQKFRNNDQKNKRENRELLKRDRGSKFFKDRGSAYQLKLTGSLGSVPRGRRHTSSSPMIFSESIHVSGDIYKANTVIMPSYHVAPHLGSNFQQKSVVTLDTLFRPFSTDPNAGGIAHFETYTGSESINGSSLNPYQSGNDFSLVSKNFPTDEQQMNDADGYPRGVGLRMPMIGVGWGYDTDGNPVPNSGDVEDGGDKTVFASGYMQRMDLWKTGPVELPWDAERKVWVGGGGSNIVLGTMDQNLLYRNSGVMNVWEYTSASGTELDSDKDFYVHDWFLPSGGLIYSGKRVGAAKIGSRYYVVASEPYC